MTKPRDGKGLSCDWNSVGGEQETNFNNIWESQIYPWLAWINTIAPSLYPCLHLSSLIAYFQLNNKKYLVTIPDYAAVLHKTPQLLPNCLRIKAEKAS